MKAKEQGTTKKRQEEETQPKKEKKTNLDFDTRLWMKVTKISYFLKEAARAYPDDIFILVKDFHDSIFHNPEEVEFLEDYTWMLQDMKKAAKARGDYAVVSAIKTLEEIANRNKARKYTGIGRIKIKSIHIIIETE